MAAFAEGLKAGKDIRSLIIRGASLKTAGAIKIIQAMILRRIHTLDLSNNTAIGKAFYETLGELFFEPSFHLGVLIFEANKMKDRCCIKLCERV